MVTAIFIASVNDIDVDVSLYIKLFGYVCLCPSGALSSSWIWLIFGMRDLWVNEKDIDYAKLHYEAVLRPKLRSKVAFTT